VHQVLFYAGSVPIGTHDVFVFFGLSVAVLVYFYEAWRRGMLSPSVVWMACGTVVCGALAAKLSTVWRYVGGAPDLSPLGAFLYGGKSILGGLAGAYVGGHVTKRVIGYRERTGDLFAPAVAGGMAVGRWGCFFSETPGTPTSLPWGITLDEATAARMPGCPANVPLHPSFVYEIVFHAAMFGLLWSLRSRMPVKGELFKIYLLAYALFRFLVEFVRGNPELAFGLSGSQLFLVPSTLVLVGYFARQLARDAYSVPAPAARGLVVED
jgi:phosphatidylglycerol---prolipoprotein diacylglyceryl transferase